MSHIWSVPLAFFREDTHVVCIVRATGHALIMLTEDWPWAKRGAYHDAFRRCESAFESDEGHEDARDAFIAALISAGVIKMLSEASIEDFVRQTVLGEAVTHDQIGGEVVQFRRFAGQS